MVKKITLLALHIIFGVSIFGQSTKGDEFFKYENYEYALEEFLNELEANPDNMDLLYKVGVCYLNTNINKTEAIPYLEKVLNSSKHQPYVNFLLGSAYHFAYRFAEARDYYYKFIKSGKGSIPDLIDCNLRIEQCNNAEEIMRFPIDVTFSNLGKNVNSKFDDYYPFVPVDESFIIYNSRREKSSVLKENGQYFANTYISKVVDGDFSEAKLTFDINSEKTDDEVVGMNSDGSKIVYYKMDFKGFGDLHLANFDRGGRASNDIVLGSTINSKYAEIAGSLTDDGRKFFFASDREGGYGGTDIYMCQILPDGKWSLALNLGPTINTSEDEDFPNIYDDGNTLYFSSKGHSSIGGYDIFKAAWNEETLSFEKIENLGYPINTPEDNMNFRLSADRKYGYISALRKEGYGGLDVYRIDFNTIEPKYTVIRGQVGVFGAEMPEKINITVYDENGEIYGDYKPNMQTLKYVIILPAGNYQMEVESEGFEVIKESISVKDKISFKPEVIMDITLKKN